jgi:RNA processing factor Prp31
VTVELKKYERDAIHNLIVNARALASMIEDDPNLHQMKLRTWATIAESFLDRIEKTGVDCE